MDQDAKWDYVAEQFTEAVRLHNAGDDAAALEVAEAVGWEHGEVEQSMLDGWMELKEFRRAKALFNSTAEARVAELQGVFENVFFKMKIDVPYPNVRREY